MEISFNKYKSIKVKIFYETAEFVNGSLNEVCLKDFALATRAALTGEGMIVNHTNR